ncbi:response regulator [Bacillus thuringiensis]|uniref:response regulator n=1 Tax=Bacillus thuringiensis TaxID=1428 RepID=UPI0021D66A42|nr:response regulator [Bacillus thuringiensis]MCU7666935.1 response regulator [Bacillus thuringiensis]
MPKKFINLYIVDNSEQFTGKLEEIFFERRHLGINVIGSAIKNRACVEDIKNTRQADVFLISAFLPDKMGIELVTYLKKNVNPNAKFIITVTTNTRNLVEQALSAGADAFLQKPFNPTKVVELIYELCGKEYEEEEEEIEENHYQDYQEEYEEEEENEFVVEDDEEENEDDAEEVFKQKSNFHVDYEEDEDDAEDIFKQKSEFMDKPNLRKQRDVTQMFSGPNTGNSLFGGVADSNKPNKVVTFTAPKSSGKTTTLVNVAASIKRNSEYDPKIVIVDLSLVYPSVQFALHHEDLQLAKKTIYDLMDDIYELDKELLRKATIVHEPTGIHIIDTPFQSIRDFTRVTKDKIKQLILFLREEYDLVLIDTSGNIRDYTTTIPMQMSDINIILFQSDFTSLVQTRKFVEMVQLLEESVDRRILDKTMLVLNRYDEGNSLSIDKARSTILDVEGLELNIPLHIPEEPEMTKYTNKGAFIVDKNGATGDRIKELATMIYPFYAGGDSSRREAKKETTSLFGSFMNKFKK